MSDRKRMVVTKVGDLAVVRFTDRKIVDSANIEEMGEEMFSLVDKDSYKDVLLNFEGVEFMSSAALNKLILMDKRVKGAQGKTAVMQPASRDIGSFHNHAAEPSVRH